MKRYKKIFKIYLDDLARAISHPGGGSVSALSFCLGVSLLQMAFNFSQNKFKKIIKELDKEKDEVICFIDRDGEIFAKLIGEKQVQKRRKYLREAQKLSLDIGRKCNKIFSIAREVDSGVRRSVKSDFYIGLKMLEASLFSSLKNLEANQIIFKIDNTKKISLLRSYLKKFEQNMNYNIC